MVYILGVSVKTHKPQAFVSNEATRNDTNYRMKFAFLSKETVPDYRPLDVSKTNLFNHLFFFILNFTD